MRILAIALLTMLGCEKLSQPEHRVVSPVRDATQIEPAAVAQEHRDVVAAQRLAPAAMAARFAEEMRDRLAHVAQLAHGDGLVLRRCADLRASLDVLEQPEATTGDRERFAADLAQLEQLADRAALATR